MVELLALAIVADPELRLVVTADGAVLVITGDDMLVEGVVLPTVAVVVAGAVLPAFAGEVVALAVVVVGLVLIAVGLMLTTPPVLGAAASISASSCELLDAGIEATGELTLKTFPAPDAVLLVVEARRLLTAVTDPEDELEVAPNKSLMVVPALAVVEPMTLPALVVVAVNVLPAGETMPPTAGSEDVTLFTLPTATPPAFAPKLPLALTKPVDRLPEATVTAVPCPITRLVGTRSLFAS